MVVVSELEPVIAVRDNHECMSILGNLSSCHLFRIYYLRLLVIWTRNCGWNFQVEPLNLCARTGSVLSNSSALNFAWLTCSDSHYLILRVTYHTLFASDLLCHCVLFFSHETDTVGQCVIMRTLGESIKPSHLKGKSSKAVTQCKQKKEHLPPIRYLCL